MREVWRRDVDRKLATATEARFEGREARHLLDEWRQIFCARFGDLVAQRKQVCIEIRCAYGGTAFVFLAHRHARLDLAEQALLLRDDRGGGCVFRHFVGHLGKRRIYPKACR